MSELVNAFGEQANDMKGARTLAKRFSIEYWLTDEGLARIRLYSNDGMTQEQIAKQIGCGLSTLKKYANENVELTKAINAGRDSLLETAEATAYEMAKGFYRTFTEYEIVTKGKKTKVVQTERRVYYPPNFKAAAFILRNRRRTKYGEEDSGAGEVVVKMGEDSDDFSG